MHLDYGNQESDIHAAQKRMKEEWDRRGIKGTIVSL